MNETQLSRFGAYGRAIDIPGPNGMNIPLAPNAKYHFVGAATLPSYADFQQEFKGFDADGGNRIFPSIPAAIADANVVGGRGDVLLVLPGHTESISSATALTMSKAGITVVGLGLGSLRPVITLDTANTATINVSGAGVVFQNCIFVSNFLAVAALFTLTTAKDFQLFNCEFRDTDATHNFIALVVTAATSNAADGLRIEQCKFFGAATSGAVKLVSAVGTNDRWSIQGNYYSSPTTNAGAVMPIATGKILTNLLMLNNTFNLKNASGTGTGYLITTDGSTNSGFIDGNKDFALPTTPLPITLASGFSYGLNWHTDQADLAGYLVPAADV